MLDALDYKIIELLSTHARMTWAELASLLKLSPPSAADRVKRLEEKGVINGYSLRLNYPILGYSVMAFIAVRLAHPKYIEGFLRAINKMNEIEECHHIAGDDDYLMKVRCRTTQHLDDFLSKRLKAVKGVAHTRTTIVLSSSKELPLSKVKH